MRRYQTDCARREQIAAAQIAAALRRHDAPNLERLALRTSALIRDCDSELVLGCGGEPMLVVTPRADAPGGPCWLVTSIAPSRLRLEAVLEDVRLDLLAEAAPDRILARLSALAGQARQDAVRRRRSAARAGA